MQGFGQNSSNRLTRDERLEARRRAKLGVGDEAPNQVPANHLTPPPQETSQAYQPNSFFMNPVSEAEEKRRKMQEEYKAYYQSQKNPEPQAYVPSNRPRPQSRGQIHIMQEKEQYKRELQKQMEEQKAMKKQSPQQQEEYFPFGKPGAGAPFRDSSGNIIAARPPRFNENDPRWFNPGKYYNKAAEAQKEAPKPQYARYSQEPQRQEFYRPPNFYAQPPDYYSGGFLPPQYPNYPEHPPVPPEYPPVPPDYPPVPPEYALPRYAPPDYPPPPAEYAPPPEYASPEHAPEYSSNYPQENPQATNLPRQESSHSEKNYQKLAEQQKKVQLNKALQEQMEEKRRKKEEEKRQKILEERLEEERLEKERRQLEEEYKRENEKKKKQMQDVFDFNAQNVSVAVAKNKPKRPRTPIDVVQPSQPTQKPQSPPKSPPKNHFFQNMVQNQQPSQQINQSELTLEANRRVQNAIESELQRLRGEFERQQNELKEAVFKLKNESQLANEQRFEAQRELERIKSEMKQKNLQEEIRQKELYSALVNTKSQKQEPIARLPPFVQPTPELPRARNEGSLSLDYAARSLVGESKFIPITQNETQFPTETPPQKKALNLDSVFPSLPEVTSNSGYDGNFTANSSLGIQNLQRRNEARISALDRIESGSNDELNKLDEILYKYLNNDIAEKPVSAYNKREQNLASIKENEEEADFSLPRSQPSQQSKRDFSYLF